MRAHQIMTRKVITVKADTHVLDAANLMLQRHISGLPMDYVHEHGRKVGEIMTQTISVPQPKTCHFRSLYD
jgi:predicted transcriptional regulator